MPPIYANDFGGYGAALQQEQALRQQAFQGAFQNLLSTLNANRNRAMQGRELQYRADQDTALRDERAVDREQRQRDADRNYGLSERYMKLQEGQVRTPEVQKAQQEYQRGEDAAARGLLDPNNFTGLPPDQIANLTALNAQARALAEDQYNELVGKARTLNLHRMLTIASQTSVPVPQVKVAAQRRLQMIQPMVDQIQKNNRGEITFDPDLGSVGGFRPTSAPPPWMKSPSADARAGQGGGSAASAAGGSRVFGQALPSPQTAPSTGSNTNAVTRRWRWDPQAGRLVPLQ